MIVIVQESGKLSRETHHLHLHVHLQSHDLTETSLDSPRETG